MHTGLDPLTISQAVALLAENGINFSAEELLTLDGFCRLRRELDNQPTQFLDSRIRRFQTFAEVRMEKGPHFGLGLDGYATWTSPIRKYSDIVNHRLLKAIIAGQSAEKPAEALAEHWQSAAVPTAWQSVMSVTGYMPVTCSRMPVQIPRSRRRSLISPAVACVSV